MSSFITRIQIISRLRENSLPYAEMPLQNGMSINVLERGGRVYGPFLEDGSESFYWLPSVFRDAAAFSWLAGNPTGWNLGGDRIWIAPEIQYLVQDLRDPINGYAVPAQMDPGNWRFEERSARLCRLSSRMDLEAMNIQKGQKSLRLDMRITPAPDPLRQLSAYSKLVRKVVYGGYEHTLTISEATTDSIQSAVWNVIQLRAGGVVYIPCLPMVEPTIYFGSLEGGYQEFRPGCVRLRLTADRIFKTGYKAAHVMGRIAYLNHLSDGRHYLLIRNFPNHPSSDYLEQPVDRLGRRGDSIYVYNDDGSTGRFGEMECMGQAIGGRSGRRSSTDTFSLWCYVGALLELRAIGKHLLGIEVTL